MRPERPPDDEARLVEVASYGMLDQDDDLGLTELAKIACAILDCPISFVGFVDRNRQWFPVHVGLPVQDTPRDGSFCNFAIHDGSDVYVVEDAREHPDFEDHPYVQGQPNIGFYAGAVMRSPNGHKLGTFCVIDTKPRHPTQEQLDALRMLRDQAVDRLLARREVQRLKAEQEEQSALLKTIAHDAASPVQSLGMRLATMAIKGEMTDFSSAAKKELHRLQRFISDLQRAAHGDAMLDLKHESADLVDALDEARDSNMLRAQEASIRLDMQVEGPLPSHCDPARMVQIVDNLLRNAIRHAARSVTIEARSEGQHAIVRIKDDGDGFEPDIAHRLFQPGFQGDNGGSKGLGLFICKQLIEQHGGSMTARSDGPGKGACFSVKVPLVANPEGRR